MTTPETLIPRENLIKGRVYRVNSRNLQLTVYDGEDGFIGIRENFGSRYLFTEYHYDCEAHGTVRSMVDTGIDVPADIPISDTGDSIDETTGRIVVWEPAIPNPNEGHERRMGWWKFIDTGAAAPTVEAGCKVAGKGNPDLFRYLDFLDPRPEVT